MEKSPRSLDEVEAIILDLFKKYDQDGVGAELLGFLRGFGAEFWGKFGRWMEMTL